MNRHVIMALEDDVDDTEESEPTLPNFPIEIICGCGRHNILEGTDPYRAHRAWLSETKGVEEVE